MEGILAMVQPSLRGSINQNVSIDGAVLLHVTNGDALVLVAFGVVRTLTLPVTKVIGHRQICEQNVLAGALYCALQLRYGTGKRHSSDGEN